MDRPERMPMRLKGYDYSAPGAYFITICTRDKRYILSSIIAPPGGDVGALHEAPENLIQLTKPGECVRLVLQELPLRFPMVKLDRYVIMPNHIHLLLRIENDRAIRESPLQGDEGRSLLSKVIGYLKMNSSRRIHRNYPALLVWQRSFYDHIVRNEDEYRLIAQYIDGNPARWTEDRFYSP